MIDEALELAIPLVKRWEGFRANPYLCTAGVWTIGYGTTRIDDVPVSPLTPPISVERAEVLLKSRLEVDARTLYRQAPMTFDANRLAALVSFVYNLGHGALRSSTLWRLHRAGEYEQAAAQFPRWVISGGRKTPGLVFRRAAEQALYLKI